MTGTPPITRIRCAACGTEIWRSTGLPLCRSCSKVCTRIFEASVNGADPDTRQRAWSRFFGGRNAKAIQAARAARMVGAR